MAVTPQDYLLFRRGEVNSETAIVVKLELANPDSEINAWLREFSNCIQRNFDFPRSFSAVRRDNFVRYLNDQVREGTISQNDREMILAQGNKTNSMHQSNGEVLLSLALMFDRFLELHPELVADVDLIKGLPGRRP